MSDNFEEVGIEEALNALTGDESEIVFDLNVNPDEWFPAKLFFRVRSHDASVAILRDGTKVWIDNKLLGAVRPTKNLECFVRMKYKPGMLGSMSIEYQATAFSVKKP